MNMLGNTVKSVRRSPLCLHWEPQLGAPEAAATPITSLSSPGTQLGCACISDHSHHLPVIIRNPGLEFLRQRPLPPPLCLLWEPRKWKKKKQNEISEIQPTQANPRVSNIKETRKSTPEIFEIIENEIMKQILEVIENIRSETLSQVIKKCQHL